MADVKRALKEENIVIFPAFIGTSLTNNKLKRTVFCEKLTAQCIKSLRSRISSFVSKETSLVHAEKTVEPIKQHRLSVLKSTITVTLKSKSSRQYITPKEMSSVLDVLTKHLNFMLPSNTYYADIIKAENVSGLITVPSLSCQGANMNISEISANEVTVRTTKNGKYEVKEVRTLSQSIDWLSVQSNGKQIKTLQAMSKAESLRLIQNINQAMELKKQQAINDVLALMQESGLSIEDLSLNLSKVA